MLKVKAVFVFVFVLTLVNRVTAVELPSVFENRIYKKTIHTVRTFRDGWPMSNPVINLNSNEAVILNFDELSTAPGDYYYTVVHCNRNWKQSIMPQTEYLNMFSEFQVTDYLPSVNTTVRYTNYELAFPNDNVPLKHSGNYAVVVFDRSTQELVLVRRFYVVEPLVEIDAQIRRGTFDNSRGETQEVDVLVTHRNFRIENPNRDTKLVIMQNFRSDNAIDDLKPLFIKNDQLEYDYNEENIFRGENEFRFFETRSIKYPGKGQQSIDLIDNRYHATLIPDQVRATQRYRFIQDINGHYLIEMMNSDKPDVEADYMYVHFTLNLDQQLFGGYVYVFGALSNWECSPENRMKWNEREKRYELSLLLKQGSYSFQYAWMDAQDKQIKMGNLEGSFAETENDYMVFFYHGMPYERYDRLIGYRKFNSNINKSYGIQSN